PGRAAAAARARPGGAVRRWWRASWLGKIGATPKSAKLTRGSASLNGPLVKLTSESPPGPARRLLGGAGEAGDVTTDNERSTDNVRHHAFPSERLGDQPDLRRAG